MSCVCESGFFVELDRMSTESAAKQWAVSSANNVYNAAKELYLCDNTFAEHVYGCRLGS